MANYLVTWEIDIDADTPEDAARTARNIQLDHGNRATYFVVFDDDGVRTAVDADPEEDS